MTTPNHEQLMTLARAITDDANVPEPHTAALALARAAAIMGARMEAVKTGGCDKAADIILVMFFDMITMLALELKIQPGLLMTHITQKMIKPPRGATH